MWPNRKKTVAKGTVLIEETDVTIPKNRRVYGQYKIDIHDSVMKISILP